MTEADIKPPVAQADGVAEPTPTEDVKPSDPEPEATADFNTPPSESTIPAVPTAVEPAFAPLDKESLPTTPRQSEEGEKHDWEVVNASPSHSPSKDRENETTKAKREREKSANSAFGKEGKIGQKIDGVRKVLKSGVFGGVGSPKSAAATRPGKTTTKPPVPSARASLAASKPGTSKASLPPTTARTTSTDTIKAPLSKSDTASNFSRRASIATASVKAKATAATATAAANKTRGDSPSPAAKTTSTTSSVKPASMAAGRPPGVLRSSTTGSLAKSTTRPPVSVGQGAKTAEPAKDGPQSRRGSIASVTSNTSASAARMAATKPRASMPLTAISKSGSKPMMPPPASTTRSMPARASVGPGTFVRKDLEDMKARIDDLEKQLAESKSELEAKTAQAEAEKTEMAESHARALDALTVELNAAGDQAKAEADRVLADLKSIHQSETDTAQQAHDSSRAELEARIVELEKVIPTLREELVVSQALAKAHQSALEEANEGRSILEEQLAALRDESEIQRKSVIGLRDESSGKDDRIEELQTKTIELSKTNEESLEMLDKMKAEIGRMSNELEMVKAIPEKDPELDEKLEALEREKAILAHESETLKGELAKSAAEAERSIEAVKGRDASSFSMGEEATRLRSTIADLEKQHDEAQSKHDALLLEAAQLSDTRIAELADERDKAVSLKNEAAAELEQNQASLQSIREELNVSSQERDEARVEVARCTEELSKVRAEMVNAKLEHEKKYASAFADAQATAAEEHAKDVDILREELAATHNEVLTGHQAALDDLKTAHAKAMADATAEHRGAVEELANRLRVAEEAVTGAEGQMEVLAKSLAEAREDGQRLQAELEAALSKSASDGESKEELAKAVRKNAELLDELEGTRTMAEMNKSQFESLREATEADHAASLREATDKSAKEMSEERQTHERMVQGLRAEIQRHRQDLEEERNEKRTLLEQVKVLQERVSGPRAQHALQGYDTSDQGESGESSGSSENASPPASGKKHVEVPPVYSDGASDSSAEAPRPEMVRLPETPLKEKEASIYDTPAPATSSAQSSASKLAALDPHPFWSDSSDSDYQSAVAPESGFQGPKSTSLSSIESSLSPPEDDRTPNAAMFNVELPDERMLWPAAPSKPAQE